MIGRERDGRGYIQPYADQNYITRQGDGWSAEFEMEEDGRLEIEARQGRGYCEEVFRTYIHADVLIQMLRQAGFTVIPPEPQVAPEV